MIKLYKYIIAKHKSLVNFKRAANEVFCASRFTENIVFRQKQGNFFLNI